MEAVRWNAAASPPQLEQGSHLLVTLMERALEPLALASGPQLLAALGTEDTPALRTAGTGADPVEQVQRGLASVAGDPFAIAGAVGDLVPARKRGVQLGSFLRL